MAWRIDGRLLLKAFMLAIWLSHSITSCAGIKVAMIHKDAGVANLHKMPLSERMARAVRRSRIRQAQVQNSTSKGIRAAAHLGEDGDFHVSVAVGNPPFVLNASLDIGGDLTWSECQPTIDCFDPSKSSSFTKVPCFNPLCVALGGLPCPGLCHYKYIFADGAIATGILSMETLTIFGIGGAGAGGGGGGGGGRGGGGGGGENAVFPETTFGCTPKLKVAVEVEGSIGLGRGQASVVQQFDQKKFSYCLAESPTNTSALFLGDLAAPLKGAKTIPYVLSNKARGSFYYLPLESISVGTQSVDIPQGLFDVKAGFSEGLIIDTGTPLTILDDSAYDLLKRAFETAVQPLPSNQTTYNSQLCYLLDQAQNIPIPQLTFHFEGGADWAFPVSNYIIQEFGTPLYCLAILPKKGAGPSILGNLMQRNFQIHFDNLNNALSFQPATCSTL